MNISEPIKAIDTNSQISYAKTKNLVINACTATGPYRDNNEDGYLIAIDYDTNMVLVVIADGMGGHPHGEAAAETILDSMLEHFETTGDPLKLAEGFSAAHKKCLRAQDGRGAVGTALVINKDNKVQWAHIGDCRLYVDDPSGTSCLTTDHGTGPYLAQCIGHNNIYPDVGAFTLLDDQQLILTTDGIHDYLELAQLVYNSDHDPTELISNLIETAHDQSRGLKHPHRDNATIITITPKENPWVSPRTD